LKDTYLATNVWRTAFTRFPISNEAWKSFSTWMPPGSLCRPTAASAADARHPQFAQSGFPPNWQGVMGFSKFAETHAVVFAKMQSSGESGGTT
jgi:hypothetical protein